MQIDSETFDNGILKVNLSGRLDVLGAQSIDMKFTALTATQKAHVLVDMSEVNFLASLGMRTLLSRLRLYPTVADTWCSTNHRPMCWMCWILLEYPA
ncbi:MAG: STAS domain-containing protein [Methylococcaceae bacterium]